MVRKSGCVRGVNLRLSQPEATAGCCGKTISSQAFSVKDREEGRREGGSRWCTVGTVYVILIQKIQK